MSDLSRNEIIKLILARTPGQPLSFANLDLSGLDLTGLKLAGVDFSGSCLSDVKFENADLAGADFSQANVTRARFVGANLNTASFIGAVAEAARFDKADVTGSNFFATDLESASGLKSAKGLDAATWELTWLPNRQDLGVTVKDHPLVRPAHRSSVPKAKSRGMFAAVTGRFGGAAANF